MIIDLQHHGFVLPQIRRPLSKGNQAPHPKFERPHGKILKSKFFLTSVNNCKCTDKVSGIYFLLDILGKSFLEFMILINYSIFTAMYRV